MDSGGSSGSSELCESRSCEEESDDVTEEVRLSSEVSRDTRPDRVAAPPP